MLRTTATDHVQNWPSYLPTVISTYRMAVHSVTDITSNMAMLVREVLTPVTLIPHPPNESITLTVPFVTSFRNAMREAHNRIRYPHNQSLAHRKLSLTNMSKILHLLSINTPGFTGHGHWFVNVTRKLTQIWTGPWKILQFISPLSQNSPYSNSQSADGTH